MNSNDPQSPPAVRVTYGGSRQNIIRRLRNGGFNSLADLVTANQMSARRASLLAGFGDRRVRVRRGERVITELEYEQLQRRLKLAEQKAARVTNSPARAPINVNALIG
jgi:hypothetical protein